MARNRQRAKDRRARHADAQGDSDARAGVRDDSPNPLEHATPDAELAEAQLAVGRPELEPDEELDVTDADLNGPEPEDGGDEIESEPSAEHAVVAHREKVAVTRRLVEFVQGSWRELQRVQWPDRRQVIQATGVVIGFVIVAGVFLGVADALAAKIVNLILK